MPILMTFDPVCVLDLRSDIDAQMQNDEVIPSFVIW